MSRWLPERPLMVFNSLSLIGIGVLVVYAGGEVAADDMTTIGLLGLGVAIIGTGLVLLEVRAMQLAVEGVGTDA